MPGSGERIADDSDCREKSKEGDPLQQEVAPAMRAGAAAGRAFLQIAGEGVDAALTVDDRP